MAQPCCVHLLQRVGQLQASMMMYALRACLPGLAFLMVCSSGCIADMPG